MPDTLLLAKAMGVSAILSASVLWMFTRAWKAATAARTGAGGVVAVGVGFIVGCWLLGVVPHWPLRQDQDRLLAVVFPSVLAVELVAVLPAVPRWVIWPLRILIVAGTGRVLLHGSSYVTDTSGPYTSEWSSGQAGLILGSLAGLQATVWALLALLVRRAPGLSHTICLAGTNAGAGVVIMLSGYATGGQIGFPLAASLIGIACTSMQLPGKVQGTGILGPAVVGLASLLTMGRFFGELTTAHFLLLLCAPLLGWMPELLGPQRAWRCFQGLIRAVLVNVLVFGVVLHAHKRFEAASDPSARSSTQEPSLQDYLDFER
jgi:hypothetical protein